MTVAAQHTAEDDVAYAGVEGQARMLREGAVTSVALVDLLLRRIERLDGQVNAFRVLLADSAREEAAAADAARAAGDTRPLLGVPIAVKDTVDVAGVATLNGTGSPEVVAQRDAEIVRRLREAGMVVLGKTNLPELALWGLTESATHGTTRNPWAPDRTPGGSSGGSAAAVAAGFVPAAHGSDGLGSIRIPASTCGLVGLKPTRGLVPLDPDPVHWDGLSHAGFLTRSAHDTGLLLDAVLDPSPGLADPGDPARLRIGVSLRPPIPGRLHPDVRRAHAETVELLRGFGHEVRWVKPPYGARDVLPALVRSWFTGSADDLAKLRDARGTEPRTRSLARIGRWARPLLPMARRAGARTTARMTAVFDKIDVLMLPTTATPAPRAGSILGRGLVTTMLRNAEFGPFTGMFNITGQPAVSVPAGLGADGVPLGVQLVAAHGDERTLLALATQIEQATGWPQRRPPVSAARDAEQRGGDVVR